MPVLTSFSFVASFAASRLCPCLHYSVIEYTFVLVSLPSLMNCLQQAYVHTLFLVIKPNTWFTNLRKLNQYYMYKSLLEAMMTLLVVEVLGHVVARVVPAGSVV